MSDHPVASSLIPYSSPSAISMRSGLFIFISSILLLGDVALADLDQSDVPDACHSACSAVVRASRRCDRNTHNDTAEMQCVCNMSQASIVIPRCEACIAQYRQDQPRDDDYDGDDDDDDDDDDNDPHDNGKWSYSSRCLYFADPAG